MNSVLVDAPLQVRVRTPDDIVRDVKHLPSAARVLPRLKQLLCDGNSSLHEIIALIRLDPGIAARVLQVANSAYFSMGNRCVTVDDAVHRVGYDHVYQLVSYAVASQVLVRPLQVYALEADQLWRMSVAGALAAEVLADRTGLDRNTAYTVGLMHCVGMVAIDEWALRNARSLTLPIGEFPKEAMDREYSIFGFTQADTGGALLRYWGFPGCIVDPVRCQYLPRATVTHVKMATLLYAAKWLRNTVCGVESTVPDQPKLAPLGLTPEALTEQVAPVAERFRAVNSLLGGVDGDVPEKDQFPAKTWAP